MSTCVCGHMGKHHLGIKCQKCPCKNYKEVSPVMKEFRYSPYNREHANSVSGYSRPPKIAKCVEDYFYAVRSSANPAAAELEYATMLTDPDSFFTPESMWEVEAPDPSALFAYSFMLECDVFDLCNPARGVINTLIEECDCGNQRVHEVACSEEDFKLMEADLKRMGFAIEDVRRIPWEERKRHSREHWEEVEGYA